MRSLAVIAVLALTTAGASPDLSTQADDFVSDQVDEGFSGAVLVAAGDQVLLHEGYGVADVSSGAPVTAETVFLIGSITKLRSHAFPHDFLELTRTEAIREILSHDLLFTPGSALSYSDDAYKLLAAHPPGGHLHQRGRHPVECGPGRSRLPRERPPHETIRRQAGTFGGRAAARGSPPGSPSGQATPATSLR